MKCKFLRAGKRRLDYLIAALALAILVDFGAGIAQSSFPFDQVLLLDIAPMRPAKRVPSLVVTSDGIGTIDLWCRSVSARIAVGERSIVIVPDALPDYAPVLKSEGQCTPERMSADEDMLAAFSEVSGWTRDASSVLLAGGGRPLRLRPLTN